jgi:hypothetical protein
VFSIGANGFSFDQGRFGNEIQVYKFMQLFKQCFDVGTEILVAALIYVERMQAMNKELCITEDNAKCHLHTSLTLAAKFNTDRFESNTIFYAIGGLTKKEMRRLHHWFLDKI